MKAVFRLALKPSSVLLYGDLSFYGDDGKEINTFIATSGVVGHQTKTSFKERGKGCVPPYPGLKIDTSGYKLPAKGIEGWFFPIVPSPIPGYGRSEIGLHHDANVPGSAGCIVVKNKAPFVEKCVPILLAAKERGIRFIPIEVKYS